MKRHHTTHTVLRQRRGPYWLRVFLTAISTLAAFPVFFACHTNASPPIVQQEINHLLTFIERSQCTYIRNGESHNGPDAAKHIRRKYKHYREEINSSEDFIRLSATKSALTGKQYAVQCPEQDTMYSSFWLERELKAFRNRKL